MASSFMRSSVIMLVMTFWVLCLNPSVSSASDKSASAINMITDTIAKEFKGCPPPYTHILGECFYIHKYIPLMNWEEAKTFCKQAGGYLAEPKYFGAVIAQIFNNEKVASDIFRGVFNRLWLGGHRVGNTTNFEWSSGRTMEDPVTLGMDYPGDNEGDCIMMIMQKDRVFELKAADCNIKTHYICQLL